VGKNTEGAVMQNQATIKVWDLGVRMFHWCLAAFFVIAYLTGDADEGATATLHAWAGYVIIGLLAFRILWGTVGSRYARFSDFVYGPVRIIAYLKDLLAGHPKRYLGHNPAGGLMVIIMIVMLSAVSWTGLKVYQAEGKGPLVAADNPIVTLAVPEARADDDEGVERAEGGNREGDKFWEEAHEASVNIMLLLIVLHLAGVAASSLMHRENLVRAMVTGRKPKRDE
jgi:cytochrome b